MSAALAVHMPSHSSSHSPSAADSNQVASGAHYNLPAPSRGTGPSPRQQTLSSPIRHPPTSMDATTRDTMASEGRAQVPSVEIAQSHPGASGGAPQPIDSRPAPAASSIEIKTERPPSPSPSQQPPSTTPNTMPRRRPHRLDLTSSNTPIPPGRPSAPLTAKESGSLSAMQDVAINCLSPGFDTSDPNRRQQMERSRDLAEQQRQIIAARQNKSGPKDLTAAKPTPADFGPPPTSFSKPLGTSRRKAPPSSLAIAPGTQVNEPRVIQSAPLGQTFSGFNRSAHPLSRQVLDHSHHHHRQQHQPQASGYGQHHPGPQPSAYSPHAKTPQSATRLPPIQDVFANENLGSPRPSSTLQRNHSDGQRVTSHTAQSLYAPITNGPPTHSPLPTNSAGSEPGSLGRGPPTLPPVQTSLASASGHSDSHMSSGQQSGSGYSQSHLRPPEREYRSAEEAVQGMTGGREDLLPKLVHYGGHQPPTPPSPLPPPGNYQPNGHPSAASYSQDRHHATSNMNLKVEAGQASSEAGIQRNDSGRRRRREEFERDLESGAAEADERERGRERERERERERGGLGFGFGAWTNDGRGLPQRHTPETARRKKEEFMSLCARAWDLMHE